MIPLIPFIHWHKPLLLEQFYRRRDRRWWHYRTACWPPQRLEGPRRGLDIRARLYVGESTFVTGRLRSNSYRR